MWEGDLTGPQDLLFNGGTHLHILVLTEVGGDLKTEEYRMDRRMSTWLIM